MTRLLLSSTAAIALLAVPAIAVAQTVPEGQTSASPVPAPVQSTPLAQPGLPGADPTPQDGSPASGDSSATGDAGTQDIIITGTLLRGIAPTGTNVIGISRDAITTTGAQSTNAILARIPQNTTTFNRLPTPSADSSVTVVTPNLRGLGTSGSPTTLVLVNGFRAVGSGLLQTAADPDSIPPGILDRVDVIPDGGSSIYGSDAIGGVINFITRRRFNGLEVSGRYGFADNYYSADATATAGKDWGSGSLVLSYAFAKHDALFGRDRSYINSDQTSRGGADNRVLTCSPGNVAVGNANYALPALTAGTNRCDPASNTTFYPSEERHSAYGSLTQKLNDDVEFNLTAYYSQRHNQSYGAGAFAGDGLAPSAGTITSTNPYFRSIAGETSQTVSFTFAGVAPSPIGQSFTNIHSYGATPSFNIKLGGGWQLRASANVGRSDSSNSTFAINQGAVSTGLAGTTAATALNPYNLAASGATALARVYDYRNDISATQELAEGRLVADGELLTLPGGSIRLAAGYEHHYENLDQTNFVGAQATPSLNNRGYQSRSVNSVFGEAFVPIFGTDNAIGGIQSLDLSASVRYDRYNDVGGTTNPKFGVNYRPFGGLKIRGNWGTSFHAPSLSDGGGAVDTRYQVLAFSPFRQQGSPITDLFRPTVLIAGGNPALRPETAHTWSAGADLTPSFVPGLTISGTYFNVDFKNAIAVTPFYAGAGFFSNAAYNNSYIINPTLAQLQAFGGNIPVDGGGTLADLYANGRSPYAVLSARRANLNSVKVSGIDFNVAYNRDTGFGSINAGVAGTYTLNRKSQAGPGAVFVNDLRNGNPNLNFLASLGGKVGPLSAQVSAAYTDSFAILGSATQTRVKSFTAANAFLSLDLGTSGVLNDTALTLNVDNIFDKDPPYSSLISTGAAFTNIGRLVTFGVRKKF